VETAQLIAFLAFLVVATLVVLGVRTGGRLLARTRIAEVFRGDVADLARRAEASFGAVSGRIDAVRRGELEPAEIGDNLVAAMDAAERYAAEARTLVGPSTTHPSRDAIVAELERVGRALDMVDHGSRILARVRHGDVDAEAQTSVKRGYLNLLHAREAIGRHAAEAIDLAEAASPVRRLGRRPT